MSRKWSVAAVVLALLGAAVVGVIMSGGATAEASASEGGVLNAIDCDGNLIGKCPLQHTSVSAEISGFVVRVTVTQVFRNPFKDKIEAVYTFPLSASGAVDEMLMKVGDRVIRGVIKRREEARKVYEDAKAAGKIASLLDQERPNIFTQSVANIRPDEKIEITIKYVEILQYEAGRFTFSFPMVVGPRFIPGEATGKEGTGWSPDTDEVPDASKITPPPTPPATRAGHDIDLTVRLDAGVAVADISSKLHEVDIKKEGKGEATVSLKNKNTIPNKDFVLEYVVAENEVKSGCLLHKSGEYGYITVILLPPKAPTPEQIAPKEMIFVVDRSGSQFGQPIEKAKETMNYILDWMNPDDTFNIISFSNEVETAFESPQKKSEETVAQAKRYISTLYGNGGTYMADAVMKACENPAPENRLRIVTFMTDGYVGNDFEVLGLVKSLRGKSRWFPFGTGNGVNRFLLDGMAELGGGEVEYILLNSPGEEVAQKFYKRISTPVLTDIRLQWEGVEVEEVFPREVSDLWAQKPLCFHARYKKPGRGTVVLHGFLGGKPYSQKLEIELPDTETANEALAPVWARAKVEMLMNKDLFGAQQGSVNKELKEEIIRTALEHRIMTQYTSFVAVEETIITEDGKPRKVAVPVEMPEGVSREGVFGPTGMPRGTSFGNLSNKNLNSASAVDAYGVGGASAGAYGQRWGAGSLPREGGSAGTEYCVTGALPWLHFHQDKDGKWSETKFSENCDASKGATCDGQVTSGDDVAATSLALLAFLGNGHTHRVGSFKKTVRKGVDWLVSRQLEDGSFAPAEAKHRVYTHAVATLALCELYAITSDANLKEVCQKAVDFITAAQNPGFAWGDAPKSGQNDTFVTAWAVQALKAARVAKLEVKQESFDGAVAWLDSVTGADGKVSVPRVGGEDQNAKESNENSSNLPTATAASIYCRLLCGQSKSDEKILKGIEILMSNLPEWDKPNAAKVDFSYWLWATQALFQYGGEKWHKWSEALKKALLDTQRIGGCADGSWDPAGKSAPVCGRMRATALASLALEVLYRYARASIETESQK